MGVVHGDGTGKTASRRCSRNGTRELTKLPKNLLKITNRSRSSPERENSTQRGHYAILKQILAKFSSRDSSHYGRLDRSLSILSAGKYGLVCQLGPGVGSPYFVDHGTFHVADAKPNKVAKALLRSI